MEKRIGLGARSVVVRAPEGVRGQVPLVVMPVFRGDGSEVWRRCQELECPAFSLVSIGGVAWERDMTPWAAEPATRREAAYEGGAPAFLAEFLDEVLPAAEADLAGAGLGVAWRGIAGYSLAGSLPCGARGRPTRSCAWRARRVPYGTRAGSALHRVRSPPPGPSAHISRWGARSTRRPTGSCATFARLRSRRGTFFAPTVSSAPSSSTPATTSRTPTCAWPTESGGFWTRPAGMRGFRGRLLRALVRRSDLRVRNSGGAVQKWPSCESVFASLQRYQLMNEYTVLKPAGR